MTSPVVGRVDLVPALLTVTEPDKASYTIDGVRVIVTIDRVYVYQEDRRGGEPNLYLEGGLEDFGGKNTTGYWVILDSGVHLQFRRSTGCACGGRIRSFRPFPQGLVMGQFGLL